MRELTSKIIAEKVIAQLRRIKKPISTGRLWVKLELSGFYESRYAVALDLLEGNGRIVRKTQVTYHTDAAGRRTRTKADVVELGVLDRLASI